MDIIENLQSTIHVLRDCLRTEDVDNKIGVDNKNGVDTYYIEEISFKRSVDHDYWLGRYGSDQRMYLGHDWSQAIDKAQGIIKGDE